KRTPNLVGYGAKESGAKRRRRRREAGAASAAPPVPEVTPPAPASPPVPAPPAPAAPAGPALAKPPVRKLAKDLGVDLRQVTPTGPNGTVSRADVEAASAGSAPASAQGERSGVAAEERLPIKGVRKLTARSEEHTSELQSRENLVCRLLL